MKELNDRIDKAIEYIYSVSNDDTPLLKPEIVEVLLILKGD